MVSTLCQLSLQSVFDPSGRPLVGAQLYVFQAGTTQPATAYSDAGLTQPLSQPILTTGSGRVPPVYIGMGTFRYRLTDPSGVILDDIDGIEGAVVTTVNNDIVQTGFEAPTGALLPYYGGGPPSGWVRANGRTIGNPTSGATEFADTSCQALFVQLWTFDTNLGVTGGRGNTALADFVAGKQLTLPDLRRRTMIGVDGMGNGLAGGPVGGIGFGVVLGEEVHALALSEMPNHAHVMSCDTEGGHIHSASCDIQGTHGHTASSDVQGAHAHSAGMDTQGGHVHGATEDVQGNHTHTGGTDVQGGHTHIYQQYSFNPSTASSGSNQVLATLNGSTNTTAEAGDHQHNVNLNTTGGHQHNLTIAEAGDHTHNITVQSNGQHNHNITVNAAGAHQHNIALADAGEHTHVVTAQPVGGSGAHNNMQPSMPVTVLIKL